MDEAQAPATYIRDDFSEVDCNQTLISPNNQANGGAQWDRMDCIINKDTPNELFCKGYKRCIWKTALSYVGIISSCGLLLLIFYWKPDWKLKCSHNRSTLSTAQAVHLAATDNTRQVFVSFIQAMSSELAHLMTSRYHTQAASSGSAEKHDVPLPSYGSTAGANSVMYFEHHESYYIWDFNLQTFLELGGLDRRATLEQIHQDSSSGLNQEELKLRQDLYGKNVITVKIPSHLELLLSEILNPFYVFQLFAVIFWMVDEYYYYASAIFVVSIISAIISLVEIRKERIRLHEMVEYHNETKIRVFRQNGAGSDVDDVWSKELVPGDVIVVPPSGLQLSCDAALVSGTCIVNESMLTGESVPVTKTPLPSNENELKDQYDTDLHKRHTLFCGTQVVQTRFYQGEPVKAVVVRTGYHTAKGQLVHGILYPKPIDMQLLRDAYRFVLVLFLIAMCGFIYTIIIQTMGGESVRDIVFNAIDLITISVPPALPLAMTIGIIYAQLRLKKRKIHCISPQRINICGQIDVVAFDKTGTLTEDGLDLSAIVPVNHKPSSFSDSLCKFIRPVHPRTIQHELGVYHDIVQCMATCHTLTIINEAVTGDPLDLKMFEATEWKLFEPKVEDESKYDQLQTTYVRPPCLENNEGTLMDSSDAFGNSHMQSQSSGDEGNIATSGDVGIVRQFPFSSALQRASVIIKPYRSGPRDMVVYMKGAPEMVAKLCKLESIPPDFQDVLKSYTQQGFRVIGMAYKPLNSSWLKAQKIERSAVESQLTFLGLVSLQNKLKPQSAGALLKLREADIRTLMVTGDNLLTSLSVARESGMIQPSDTILLAHATLPDVAGPATLTWHLSESSGSGSNNYCDSPYSSSELKLENGKREVRISIEEQLPSSWHLAVSGQDFSIIQDFFPEWMEVIAVKGTIFARMSPSQKTSLMEELQSVNYHVCMCGDGANDCGALKRAHAGLSLSEFEASVAAPFTCHTELGIECVPTLIREGRAALVTSFGVFKFMALYSIIQFCSVTILYNDSSNLSDLQFLYIDLIVIDVVALTMSRNHAHKTLHYKRPPSSLVSIEMLVSLMFQICLQLGAQVSVFLLVKQQCWYTSLSPAEAKNSTVSNNTACPELNHIPDQSEVENDDNILTYENSVIFLLSSFLYMSVSVAFSRGVPFRTRINKNKVFVSSLIILLVISLFFTFFSPLVVDNVIQLRVIPDNVFLGLLVGIAGLHLVVAVAFEMMVVENATLWESMRGVCRCFYRNHVSKRYKIILNYFNLDHAISAKTKHIPGNAGELCAGDNVPNPMEVVNQTLKSNIKARNIVSIKTKL